MRFVITLTPGKNAPPPDPNAPFSEAIFMAHMKYNEDMHKAGVLLASEGLNPGKQGAHVVVSGATRTVVDGPYTETKELVGGFYLLEVSSRDEAIAWAKRYPGNMSGTEEVLEIRPLTGSADLPPELLALIRKAAPTWSAAFEGTKTR